MVKLLYLARLRESLGVSTEEVALPEGVHNVHGLRQWLCGRGELWTGELSSGHRIRVAVNHALAEEKTVIADGDEVAFFPPVTGG